MASRPYAIILSKSAAKGLKKIPAEFKERILTALQELRIDPLAGKPLQGELKGLYSLRVWPYRIIYRINRQKVIIEVLDIGHRQGIYQ